MSKLQFTQEQITQGFVDPIVKILSQGLSQVPGEQVDDIVAQIKDAIGKVETNQELDVAVIIDSSLTIAQTVAEATPTKKDDAVIAALQLFKGILLGNSGKGGLLGNVIELAKSIKAAKKAE